MHDILTKSRWCTKIQQHSQHRKTLKNETKPNQAIGYEIKLYLFVVCRFQRRNWVSPPHRTPKVIYSAVSNTVSLKHFFSFSIGFFSSNSKKKEQFKNICTLITILSLWCLISRYINMQLNYDENLRYGYFENGNITGWMHVILYFISSWSLQNLNVFNLED